ncbi:hypothetical protein [uncultured Cohaesibacter sp.]|uniref:hypothetical protein n=1 Tax=uncultured Cohaesibacter sp. TaxID=1002546 RepID=UPI002AAB96B8|nr:hypothetical protein [uncultured Cohaesibacter sp.]
MSADLLNSMTRSEAIQLLAAVIAGGYLSLFLNEAFQRRRELKSNRRQRLEQIVQTFYRYGRLLRQKPELVSDADLDFLHADFCAQIKLLSYDVRFEEEAEALRILSQQMANIRNGQSRVGEEKKDMNAASRDFNNVLEQMLKKC